MFERYMGAKAEKPNKWVNITITVSFGLHVVAGLSLLVWSFWKIEKLVVKDNSVLYMAAAISTPPPPPPPPPPPKKSSVKKTEIKPKTNEIVQPDKDVKPPEPEEQEDEGVEGGVEGGVAGGVVGGVEGGTVGSVEPTPVKPPPTPPPAPVQVAQAMLEGSRVAGDPHIQLADSQVMMLQGQGVRKLQVKTKMCLSESGSPRAASITKGSGYSDIDSRIQGEMMKWRYRPYVVGGKPVQVCFPVIFNYKIQ